MFKGNIDSLLIIDKLTLIVEINDQHKKNNGTIIRWLNYIN